MTWEDLAEQQEMLAKAWTFRARPREGVDRSARLRAAMLDDAAEASANAANYRLNHAAGWPLDQKFAYWLSVVP